MFMSNVFSWNMFLAKRQNPCRFGLRKTHGLSLVEPWRAEAALGTPSGGQWKWTLGLSLDDLKKDGFGGRSLVLARAPASLLSKAREKLVRY